MLATTSGAAALRAAHLLADMPGPVHRVLEVGAGAGHLVHALRAQGVSADGVEPSSAGRELALSLHSVSLVERIEDLDVPTGGYDGCVLLHSLEHMRDPARALRGISDLLARGGGVFIEVPHVASVEMWRPQRRRQILDLPAHLYHFTPESLARLVRAAGLAVRTVKTFNPELVERLLALRRPRMGAGSGAESDSVSRVDAAAGLTPAGSRPERGLTRGVHHRLLAWVRARFPGWKFQLVAQRP